MGIVQETALLGHTVFNHQNGLLYTKFSLHPESVMKNSLLNEKVLECFLSALLLSLCPFIHHLSPSPALSNPKYHSYSGDPWGHVRMLDDGVMGHIAGGMCVAV